ncbi:MAG: hypothetical protein OIN66_03285 [Candidatus Methanoperedens sp.]|nr:hypothetical protein [Candidatus Methanoperedens sp.]
MDKNKFVTWIGKSLLKFFVLTLILVYGLVYITEYDNLKPIVSELTAKVITETQAKGGTDQQITQGIIQQCKNTDRLIIPIGDESLTIDCKEVQAKGDAALSQYISEAVSNVILKDYYKDYGCSPTDCIKSLVVDRNTKDMGFVISAQMNQFLKKLIPYLAVGVVLSLFILVYLIRDPLVISKEVGMTLLSAGFPFLFFVLVKYREQLLVSTGILSGKEDFMRSANEFLSGPIYNVTNLYTYMYGIVFAIGAVLAIIGYVGIKKREKDAKISEGSRL